MNPYCYKCTSAENLSIKARKRNGDVRLWICKFCRNSVHKATVTKQKAEHKPKDTIDWYKLSKESNARILARFGNAN